MPMVDAVSANLVSSPYHVSEKLVIFLAPVNLWPVGVWGSIGVDRVSVGDQEERSGEASLSRIGTACSNWQRSPSSNVREIIAGRFIVLVRSGQYRIQTRQYRFFDSSPCERNDTPHISHV